MPTIKKPMKTPSMLSKFKGYRTYFCAAGIGLATAALALGWIDEILYQTLLGLFGAGGLAGLRAAK